LASLFTKAKRYQTEQIYALQDKHATFLKIIISKFNDCINHIITPKAEADIHDETKEEI